MVGDHPDLVSQRIMLEFKLLNDESNKVKLFPRDDRAGELVLALKMIGGVEPAFILPTGNRERITEIILEDYIRLPELIEKLPVLSFIKFINCPFGTNDGVLSSIPRPQLVQKLSFTGKNHVKRDTIYQGISKCEDLRTIHCYKANLTKLDQELMDWKGSKIELCLEKEDPTWPLHRLRKMALLGHKMAWLGKILVGGHDMLDWVHGRDNLLRSGYL